jgi:hypothetical protein
MYYYALLNFGSNEFGPVNKEDMMFIICTMIISVLISNIVLGDISSLMGSL